MSLASELLASADRLCLVLSKLRFGGAVTHVYNPLEYARAPYAMYLERFAATRKKVLYFGMNPGPYGMTQTGIPFGEIAHVRDWLGIEAPVSRPPHEHPKRPVVGFACTRSEVSGARLWGMFKALYGTPARFFAHALVVNYCPLVFMDDGGRNVTPDKLAPPERAALYAPCNEHLRTVVATLTPSWVVGVGKFAESRAREALGDDVQIGTMPHPSPANPNANRDWAGVAQAALEAQGVPLGELNPRA